MGAERVSAALACARITVVLRELRRLVPAHSPADGFLTAAALHVDAAGTALSATGPELVPAGALLQRAGTLVGEVAAMDGGGEGEALANLARLLDRLGQLLAAP